MVQARDWLELRNSVKKMFANICGNFFLYVQVCIEIQKD